MRTVLAVLVVLVVSAACFGNLGTIQDRVIMRAAYFSAVGIKCYACCLFLIVLVTGAAHVINYNFGLTGYFWS